jgi:hypothetical protein
MQAKEKNLFKPLKNTPKIGLRHAVLYAMIRGISSRLLWCGIVQSKLSS